MLLHRQRRTLHNLMIVPYIKSFILRWLINVEQERELPVDDLLMSGFVCRPCFWVYESYITKGNKMYEAIESSCLRLLCSSTVQEVTKQSEPTKKRKKTVLLLIDVIQFLVQPCLCKNSFHCFINVIKV